MSNTVAAAVAVLSAIVGLAIVAVVVGQRAQTANVINAGGSALSKIITAAVGPVSGNSALSGFGSNFLGSN